MTLNEDSPVHVVSSVRMHAESMLEVLHVQYYIRLFGCIACVCICIYISPSMYIGESTTLFFNVLLFCKSAFSPISRASLELRL